MIKENLKLLLKKEDPNLDLETEKVQKMLALAEELLPLPPLKIKGFFDKDYIEFKNSIVSDMIHAIKNDEIDEEIALLSAELDHIKGK